jgi:hypothetical protein
LSEHSWKRSSWQTYTDLKVYTKATVIMTVWYLWQHIKGWLTDPYTHTVNEFLTQLPCQFNEEIGL